MFKTILTSLFIVLLSATTFAHCQIPCGIYDDPRQFSELKEHAKTIDKSIRSMQSLSSEEKSNQLTRWVVNKESHATKIQDIINHYFLIQRIKSPTQDNTDAVELYNNLLSSAHSILVLAMKTKQQASLSVSAELLMAINQFEEVYQSYK